MPFESGTPLRPIFKDNDFLYTRVADIQLSYPWHLSAIGDHLNPLKTSDGMEANDAEDRNVAKDRIAEQRSRSTLTLRHLVENSIVDDRIYRLLTHTHQEILSSTVELIQNTSKSARVQSSHETQRKEEGTTPELEVWRRQGPSFRKQILNTTLYHGRHISIESCDPENFSFPLGVSRRADQGSMYLISTDVA